MYLGIAQRKSRVVGNLRGGNKSVAIHDDLGTRMKEYYESVPRIKLVRRMPVAIRIDGKAFHTFTRGFQKPFDMALVKAMQGTMKYLCENVQGCVFGYTQSDEITLILVDYQTLTTSAWFDYEVQKLCSISASMATIAFDKIFIDKAVSETVEFDDVTRTRVMASLKGAMFDSRCFNIPKEEVTNLIYWRQLDAQRNSIQMVGQSKFSHKQLQNKNCIDIKQMLMDEYQINWDDYPIELKIGSACVKTECGWEIDHEMPMLKGEGRAYLDDIVCVG